MNFFGSIIAWITWDISREIWVLPYVHLPLTWYGLFFAGGFWLALSLFIFLYQSHLKQINWFAKSDIDWKALEKSPFRHIKEGDLTACDNLLKGDDPFGKRAFLERTYPKAFLPVKERAKRFAESLLIYVIIGAVLGARLGHVFFYEEPLEYLMHPLSILKTWEGGLASHGGILAVVLAALLFYYRHKKEVSLTFLHLLDLMAIPTMLVVSLVRIGNFFNQEILGVPTTKPWGIIFLHPADGLPAIPRHPAQLYEAAFYFLVFVSIFALWKWKKGRVARGRIAGLAILFSFTFRFLIESIKTGQSVWFDREEPMLLMGQLLSFPLIALGAYLLFRSRKSAPDLG